MFLFDSTPKVLSEPADHITVTDLRKPRDPETARADHAAELARDDKNRATYGLIALTCAIGAVGLAAVIPNKQVVCRGEQPAEKVTLSGKGAGDYKMTVDVAQGDWVAFSDMGGSIIRKRVDEEGNLTKERLDLEGALYPGDVIVDLPKSCENQ